MKEGRVSKLFQNLLIASLKKVDINCHGKMILILFSIHQPIKFDWLWMNLYVKKNKLFDFFEIILFDICCLPPDWIHIATILISHMFHWFDCFYCHLKNNLNLKMFFLPLNVYQLNLFYHDWFKLIYIWNIPYDDQFSMFSSWSTKKCFQHLFTSIKIKNQIMILLPHQFQIFQFINRLIFHIVTFPSIDINSLLAKLLSSVT